MLVGADYSQQEPKMLATLSDDENMIQAASEGKDMYSTVAARAFHTTYEDCLEHFPQGTPIVQNEDKTWRYATEEEIKNKQYDKIADGENDTYKAGKWRRTQAKIILLGLMYSRGANSLAAQLGCSYSEALDIMNTIFAAFPKVKAFDENSKEFCYKHGYTTTLWGRKRRLPDIRLPRYEITFKDKQLEANHGDSVKTQITKTLDRIRKQDEKAATLKELQKTFNCRIIDNTSKIAQAERQVVNARVQGSASDMTKKAIIAINRNERLKELGFNAIAPIHDEIIAQCPLANIQECKELFMKEMCNAASDKMKIKITVDPVVSFEWAGEPIAV